MPRFPHLSLRQRPCRRAVIVADTVQWGCVGSACTVYPWSCSRELPEASGAGRIPKDPLSASLPVSHAQNIRVWDMQDYICLQSFCGKLFALGNCPITSAYFHKNDNTLICSTYSVSLRRRRVMAAHTGWPRGWGLTSQRALEGWLHPVPPKSTLHDMRTKLLDPVAWPEAPISCDFLEDRL